VFTYEGHIENPRKVTYKYRQKAITFWLVDDHDMPSRPSSSTSSIKLKNCAPFSLLLLCAVYTREGICGHYEQQIYKRNSQIFLGTFESIRSDEASGSVRKRQEASRIEFTLVDDFAIRRCLQFNPLDPLASSHSLCNPSNMSMFVKLLATCAAFVGIGTYAETRFFTEAVPFLYEPSEVMPALPRAFGFLLFLLSAFGFWMLIFGFQVGQARKKYRALAEKADEKDLDQYDLPNLYASGSTENAKAFNAVQRAHQHVLESITPLYVMSVLTATVYPLTTSLNVLLWIIGRINWSTKYAEGGASSRYGHFTSYWIWYGLMINFMLGALVSLNFLFGSFY
jgi:glutathione S-transferase